MSIEIKQRVLCDEPHCLAAGPWAETRDGARNRARHDGWDLGPHETRKGVWSHSDYCPEHKDTS
jgi:hypothetical protein